MSDDDTYTINIKLYPDLVVFGPPVVIPYEPAWWITLGDNFYEVGKLFKPCECCCCTGACDE